MPLLPGSAAHSTTETASVVSLPSSSLIGGSSAVRVRVAVHPGTGWVLTEAKGGSVGRWARTFTVLSVSLSLGTLKTILPYPPAAASGDDTPTCAEATPTPRVSRPTSTVRTTPSRVAGRGRGTVLLGVVVTFAESADREVGGGGAGGELVGPDGD